MKLYVGNLSFETTENDLQDLFEQPGKVTEVALINDKMTGRSRGFGFVTMADVASGTAALNALRESIAGAFGANRVQRRSEIAAPWAGPRVTKEPP